MLVEVLARLQEYGVKAKKSKCCFMQPSVTYLGHIIDGEGTHPTQDKVPGILNAKAPTNVDELEKIYWSSSILLQVYS